MQIYENKLKTENQNQKKRSQTQFSPYGKADSDPPPPLIALKKQPNIYLCGHEAHSLNLRGAADRNPPFHKKKLGLRGSILCGGSESAFS
ncbi:MAG: hypothetical protein HDR86_00970 [Bacteroides sp.]|nr:hypothetical protein [Bacteroides sp.]